MGQTTWTFTEFQARRGLSVHDLFPHMFGRQWEEARCIFYAVFEENHLETLKAVPGAAGMLATLHKSGLVLGVVSNKNGRYLRYEAKHLQWNSYFHSLVGAMDAARNKPAAEPVWLALEGTGIPPGNNVWFVGDSLIDMECAYNAGCLPVLLRSQPPAEGEFVECWPNYYFAHCDALIRAVQESLVPGIRLFGDNEDRVHVTYHRDSQGKP